MRYTIVIVAALLTAAATTAFCDSYEIKVYPCARATDGVVIDGDLRDAAWQRAPSAWAVAWMCRQGRVGLSCAWCCGWV